MIVVEDLDVSFKDKAVLKDFTFHVPKGKILGIYGESGCGKTTIAKVLCGLIKPKNGNVFYDGEKLWDNGRYNREKGLYIQMVYQQPEASLDPSYRVGKTLEEVLSKTKLSKQEKKERILEVLESLGLSKDILGHYPYQISGGEAQRVSLARCLLLNPRVLILDEATSMLDSEIQAFLLNWLKKNYIQENTSILFISHDWELTQFYCDEVFQFQKGELKKYEKEN